MKAICIGRRIGLEDYLDYRMEKIIELLNEAIKNGLDFQGNDILKIEYYSDIDIRAYYDKTARAYYNITDEDIISKRAGFIKRLVDNNKINFPLIPNKIKEIGIPIEINGEIKYGFDSSDYYWLLMLLSIQDSPIGFLVSILK